MLCLSSFMFNLAVSSYLYQAGVYSTQYTVADIENMEVVMHVLMEVLAILFELHVTSQYNIRTMLSSI